MERRGIATPDPTYEDFLARLGRVVPELQGHWIDKQYLRGPGEDGIELSVSVGLEACTVRLVLTGARMAAGDAVLDAALRLAGEEPATEVYSLTPTTRFSVVASRPGRFPFSDPEVVEAWVGMWTRRMQTLRARLRSGDLG